MTSKDKTFSLSDKAIVVVFGHLISSIAGILLPIILVRLITKGEYGSYKQVMLLYSTFGLIFLFGIPQSIYYFIPQLSKRKKGKFILQSYTFLFLLGAFLTLAFYLLSDSIGKCFNNDMLSFYVKVFSPYFLFMMPLQSLSPALICSDKHKRAAIATIGFKLIFIISVLLPLFFGCPLHIVFRSIVAFACIQFVLVTFYIRKNMLSGLNIGDVLPDVNLAKRQIGYGLPVGLSGAAGIVSRTLDKYVVSGFFTPEQFAVYSIGAKELPLVNVLPYSISNVIQPKLVEYYHSGQQDRFMELWHGAVRRVSLIIVPMFVILFIIAQQFITFLYTENYVESTSVFRIYLCILPLRVTAYGPILMAMGHPKTVLRISLISLSMNFILNLLLIHVVGFIGPAIATVITVYATTILYLLKISSVSRIDFRKIFPFRQFLKILIIAGICGLLVLPLSLLKLSTLTILLTQIFSFGVCYIVITRRFRVLCDNDVMLIKKWFSFRSLWRMFVKK